MATSGVEKIIKVWTPYQIPNCSGGLLGHDYEYVPKRKLYTYKDLFSLRTSNVSTNVNSVSSANNAPNVDPNDLALLSYVPVIRNRLDTEIQDSFEEDKIILAFFDSQVNRSRKNCAEENKRRYKKAKLSLNSSEVVSNSDSAEDGSNSLFTSEQDSDTDSSSSSNDDSHIESSMSETSDESLSSDQNNNQNKKESRNYFSSSLSSSTSSSDESSNGLNVDNLLQSTASNCSKMHKNSSSYLRNRMRNLRHRRSLNIESQSDFKNVLNSLNVVVNEQKDELADENIQIKMVANESTKPNLEIEIEKNHSSSLKNLKDQASNAEIILPRSSNCYKESLNRVKNLNEQKRRIELNEDELSETDHNKIQRFNDLSDKDDLEKNLSSNESTNKQPLFKKKNKNERFKDTKSNGDSSNNEARNYRSHNNVSPNKTINTNSTQSKINSKKSPDKS